MTSDTAPPGAGPGPRRPAPAARRVGLPAVYAVIGTFVVPGATARAEVLVVRDATNQGLEILHGAFVRPGTSCVLALVGRGNTMLCKTRGQVARCAHISGSVHIIGIRFDDEVRLDLLAPGLRPTQEQAARASLLALSAQVARQIRAQELAEDVRRTVEVMAVFAEQIAPTADRDEQRRTA